MTGGDQVEMAPLFQAARDYLRERPHTRLESVDLAELRERFGLRQVGVPEVVTRAELAAELGHPATASRVVLLTTRRPELVHRGAITLVGPDIPRFRLGERRPLGLVVLTALVGQVDLHQLERARILGHRLPGWSVRAMPQRLWVRISRAGRGLCAEAVGSALVGVHEEVPGVAAAEVVLITSSDADVEALEPLAIHAEVALGRHRKLALAGDGSVECEDQACDVCDDKPVCDELREVVRIRRARR